MDIRDCKTAQDIVKHFKGQKIRLKMWESQDTWPDYFIPESVDDCGRMRGATIGKSSKHSRQNDYWTVISGGNKDYSWELFSVPDLGDAIVDLIKKYMDARCANSGAFLSAESYNTIEDLVREVHKTIETCKELTS